jgi:hypothetical protein
MTEYCIWNEDKDGMWRTDCDQFSDGTPTENSYKFCPYCGKELKEEKYEGDGNHEQKIEKMGTDAETISQTQAYVRSKIQDRKKSDPHDAIDVVLR